MDRKCTLTFLLRLLIFLNIFLIHDFAFAQQSKTEEIDLASALLAAKTQEERNQLLETRKHLVTSELVKALNEKGNEFRIRGEFTDARHSFELAKSLAESLNDRSGTADALNGIGVTYYMQSDFNRALENFNESLKLSEAIGNQSGIAQSFNHIGRAHYMLQDFNLAYKYYQKSLSIREGLLDQAGIAESLGSIGALLYMRTEYSKALEYLHRCLALRERLKDDDGIASALYNIGLVQLEMRNAELAEDYFKKTLALREKLGDRFGIAMILSALGSLQYHQANYEEALDDYQQSLKLFEESGNKMMKGWNLGAIGQVHEALGQYRLALEAYQKSLEIREQLGEKSGIANTLNLMGSVQHMQGNYKVALEYHKKSLQLSESLQDKKESANALNLMGNSYEMLNENEKALECFEKSLSMYEAIPDRFTISIVLNDIAFVQSKMGNHELALKNLERSLAICKEINKRDGTVRALNRISAIQNEQGKYAEALNSANQASSLARTIGSRQLLWSTLMNQGKAYSAIKQHEKAFQSFEEAIHIIETLRVDIAGGEQEQQRFFENKVAPYHLMVDSLVQKPGKETEALAYAERAKARALLDVLKSGKAGITGAMTQEELEEERNLNRKLSSLNQQVHQVKLESKPNETKLKELTANLDKARLRMEEFRTTVYAAHPELKVQRGEAEMVTPKRLSELLPDSAAFLEYVVTTEKTFLFVVAKTQDQTANTQVYTINIPQADLLLRIKDFRKELASRKPGFRKESTALYKLLLEPAVVILKTKRNLVIVPDDVLWELPFQALLTPKDRYLLEEYSLSYVPSLTVFNEMYNLKKKKPDSSISLFALGNPTLGTKTREQVQKTYRDAKLDPLPEAEKEVKALARLYGDQQSTIYVGANAREEHLKNEAGRFNFIHLATHGLLNDATPMYSQILLAQSDAQEEDGLLEAWEILNLKLNADLVVLSACDTALGRVGKGEGMIGLTWALFVAGVPTTVVSQWTVDSASTTELMIQFHKNLKLNLLDSASKTSIPHALRSAALNLLKKDEYRHPFYWAPFVVIGAGF